MTESEPPISASFVRDLFRLDGRLAVVTGGGSGLGKAIVYGFVHAGANVVVADVNLDAADEVAASCASDGNATALAVDVTERASVDRLVPQYGNGSAASTCSSTAQVSPLAIRPKTFRKRTGIASFV
jgi:hypothetical protein